MSVGLLYIATAVFALCIFLSCGLIAFCFYRVQKTPHVMPNAMKIVASIAEQGQLALTQQQPEAPKLKGPRDVNRVRAELIDVLTKAEELKSELDRVMASTPVATLPVPP